MVGDADSEGDGSRSSLAGVLAWGMLGCYCYPHDDAMNGVSASARRDEAKELTKHDDGSCRVFGVSPKEVLLASSSCYERKWCAWALLLAMANNSLHLCRCFYMLPQPTRLVESTGKGARLANDPEWYIAAC